MMKTTTTKLHVAVLAAGLSTLSGCSLLVRAAKGELTPVGAEQASGGDINSRLGTVRSSTDPVAFKKSFTELSSIYMYKCMEAPNMVPKEGSSDIRVRAGEGLLEAMKQRAAKIGADDPTLDAASADLAALEGRMSKCDADKRTKQDPSGLFGEALAMVGRDGREAYMNGVASSVDGDLQTAMAQSDQAVRQWVNNKCGVLLPVWGYCAPRAVEALHAEGKWASIGNVFLASNNAETDQLLPGLAAKVGQDELVDEVRSYLMSAKAVAEVSADGLESMAGFLADSGAWGSCDDRKGLLRAAMMSDNASVGVWSINHIVEEKCSNLDGELIKALGSDSPWIREKAAWASGELGIKKAKKHLERLRWSDPYMDEGCWCRPVRDAASNAYNKLEIAEG
ncbi:MAG: HEAT repeat domain-containing protein [Nannocystaceae bacterium]